MPSTTPVFYYTSGRVRPNPQAHYWPDNPRQRKVFFADGSFSVRLPEGAYTLIAGKGTEYLPVPQTVSVKASETVTRRIALKRWVDMPARGWYSGDGHVHFERRDPEANRRLLLWTQAEDVHVANVLRMGAARQTYFEQYGFGKPGRFVSGAYAIVPGPGGSAHQHHRPYDASESAKADASSGSLLPLRSGVR